MNRIKRTIVMRLTCMFAVVAALFGSMGCTHNNGDIGDWFGTWQMTSVEIDGQPDDTYAGNVFWKFQSNVVALVRVNIGVADHNRRTAWGTWSDEGDRLLLDFSYSDDENSVEEGAVGSGQYAPLAETYLPYGEVSVLTIENRTGGEMTLKYVAHDEVVYTYRIEKQ